MISLVTMRNLFLRSIVIVSKYHKLYLVILILASCVCSSYAQVSQSRNLYVIAPRALYEGVLILEKVFQVPISFEEHPYDYAGDSQPLFSNSVARIPKYRTIVVQYDLAAGPRVAIQRLLDAYHKQSGTPLYSCSVAQSGSGYKIAPQKINSLTVRDSDHESALKEVIEYTPSKGDSLESVFLNIRNAYTNITKSKVYCFTPNLSDQLNKWDLVRALGRKSAVQYLETVVNEYNRRGEGLISWSLLREPDTKCEVLGCHIITGISQGEHQLRVIGPRPLSPALAIIQKDYGSLIGYEDPPLMCGCDIIFDTNGLPMIPSGGSITFTYSLTNSVKYVLQSIIDSYAFQGNTGIFSMSSVAPNIYTVFPVKGRNEMGVDIPVNALSKMHLPVDGKVAVDIACKRLQEISGKSISLFEGSTNDNVYLSRILTPPKDCSSLDCILATLLLETSGNKSWRLKYDFGSYTLLVENVDNYIR